jgi:hypothetical protein
VRVTRAFVFGLILVAGCASAPPAAPLHVVHARGFQLRHDGCLAPEQEEALLVELERARIDIAKVLGDRAAPGDFRSHDERARATCPPGGALAGEVPVTVTRDTGRCHADEAGLTLMSNHLERKDGTHELVHYLAGGSWRPVDEGLAVHLTEKLHGAAWGVSVDVRARAYFDVGLDEGLTGDRLRLGMSRRDYDLAGSFVRWLIEERGWPLFFELYKGAPGDYHTVYGVSEQELVARWREKIMGLNVRQNAAYYRFKDHLTRTRSGE